MTEAFIGERSDTTRLDNGTVTITDRGTGLEGDVDVTAYSSFTATAKHLGFNVAALSINVALPVALLAGQTRAYVGPRTTLSADDVTIIAEDKVLLAEASTTSGSVSVASVNVMVAEAAVAQETQGFVGHHADLNLTGILDITAKTVFDDPVATASVTGGSGGVVDVGVFTAKAAVGDYTANDDALASYSVDSATRAFIDHDAEVGAASIELDADSKTTSNASINFFQVGAAAATIAAADATNGHDTQAYVGDDADIDISGTLTIDAFGEVFATPNVDTVSVSAGFSVSVLRAEGKITAEESAWIGNGAEVDAGGLQMHATGEHTVSVPLDSTSVSLALSIAALNANAKDSGGTSVRIGPTGGGSSDNRTMLTLGGDLVAHAKLTSNLTAKPKLVGFGLAANGSISTARATQTATVAARVGGWADINAPNVRVEAEFLGTTIATASTVSASLGVRAVNSNAIATHDAQVDAIVAGNADVAATGVGGLLEVTARHNYGDDPILDRGAKADASNLSLALGIALDIGTDADAISNPDLTTVVEADADLRAPNGTVPCPGPQLGHRLRNAQQRLRGPDRRCYRGWHGADSQRYDDAAVPR